MTAPEEAARQARTLIEQAAGIIRDHADFDGDAGHYADLEVDTWMIEAGRFLRLDTSNQHGSHPVAPTS